MAEYKLSFTGAQIDDKLATMATVDYVNNAISGQAIDIVQESGTSTTAVMSQKAVTDYVTSQVSGVMPEFVDSVDQMTDTAKKYVLSETDTIWVYGETTVDVGKVNQFDISKAKINTRLATSAEAALNGYFATDIMPLPDGWSASKDFKVRISGVSELCENDRIWYVDASGNILTVLYLNTEVANSRVLFEEQDDGSFLGNICKYQSTSTDYINLGSTTLAAYGIRMCFHLNTNQTAITQDNLEAANISIIFEDATETEIADAWYDTNVAWSAGGTDVTDIVIQMNENTSAIAKLEDAVDNLSNGGGTVVTIPDYWQEKYDSVVESVKELQVAGGADVINFCWFSDLHYVPTSEYTKNVGKLCAAVMNECDVPFTLFTGDTTTASGLPTEKTLLDYIDGAQDMLSPIGHENLLTCWGNHDDVWGTYTPSGGTTLHFVNKVASPKMWYHMHRLQAKDTRRHYGEHGTYFYIDDNPRRVRFICLNCQFYDGDAISATTGQMTGGYGTEQLDWLENVALDLPSGYSAIIAVHNPPTAQAINGVTTYLSQIPDGEDLRSIIQASTADIIALFAGHCHADAYVSGDLKCPIVTITSAVNTPYDADWSTRVAGTDTETVIDVVTINKSTRKINCTRLGYGSDREISY